MHLTLSAVPFFRVLLWLSLSMPVAARAGERPSGFGDAPTASERELAAMPGPNVWFREMAGDWHGPRGLAPLRERWRGFAGEDPAFAVLAALVAEAEGDPDRTLADLRAVPGDFARWNEGRVLAILGRLHEAEMVLSALIPPPARPEVAAAAVLALTELDCIRGDFAAALTRTTAAWELRKEDAFRLRIVERHVSLLVQKRREGPFLESLIRSALSDAEEASRASSRALLGRLSPWFRTDARVVETQRQAAAEPAAALALWNALPGDPAGRYWWIEKLKPSPETLDLIARREGVPMDLAGVLGARLAPRGSLPERLEDLPFLKRLLAASPLTVCSQVFQHMDPGLPPPALLARAAEAARPEAVRLALELVHRAWSGAAEPADVEALARIAATAPEAGGLREPFGNRGRTVPIDGWPVFSGYPAAEVVWNFRGADWVRHYRLSCRLAPLRFNTLVPSPRREVPPAPAGWAEWRPPFPGEGAAELTRWAWRELRARGGATPRRFDAILQQLAAPADRIRFAVECGRDDLLRLWCGDAEFVRRLPSAALTLAAHTLSRLGPEDLEFSREEGAGAVLRLVTEMAGRLALSPADLARMDGGFCGVLPAPWREEWGGGDPPVDHDLARVLGFHSSHGNWRAAWEAGQPGALPHALWGFPVCPSIDRLMWMKPYFETPRPPRFQTASASVFLKYLFGEEDSFPLSTRVPAGRIAAVAGFATAHPLRRQLVRWAELSADLPKGDFFFQKGSWEGVNTAWCGALRILAVEEKAHHPWEVLAAELEEDPERRAVAREGLRNGGPFRAGLFAPTSSGEDDASGPPPEAARAKESPADAAMRHFRLMLATPDSRKALEQAGAGAALIRQDPPPFFVAAWRNVPPAERPGLAERLLELRDPLAARMAVMTAAGWNDGNPQTRKSREEWLARALALFPGEPELLLAQACEKPEKERPAAEALFRQALGGLTAVAEGRASEDPAWCGSESFVVLRQWTEPRSLEAIAAFADRVRPRALPNTWAGSLEKAFATPETAAALPELEKAALVLARYRPVELPLPWDFSDSFRWDAVLDALLAKGHREAAARVAEMVLTKPRGQVMSEYGAEACAPRWAPWENTNGRTDPAEAVDGWRWLQVARGDDPAGLADRLEAAFAAEPGEEQLAMAAFVARALARPLTAEDTARLSSLTPGGQLRVLARAAAVLPPDKLPPALCLEAWEKRAEALLSDRAQGDIRLALNYMDRLRGAGAEDAVRRLVSPLLDFLAESKWFPEEQARLVEVLVHMADGEEAPRRLRAILARYVRDLPMEHRGPQALADAMAMYDEAAEMPPELSSRVETTLRAPIFDGWAAWKEKRLAPLAVAAAAHPRFHNAVRELVRSLPNGGNPAPEPDSEQWTALISLFQALDGGPAVPDVALRFDAGKPGEGTLHWRFQGILLPRVVDYFTRNAVHPVEPAWAPLAARLADGAFDAAVLAEGQDMVAPVEVGSVSAMGASGSIPLSGLKPLGRFHLRLTGKAGANPPAGESRTVGYNSLPPLADSGGAQAVVSKSPPGWRLVTEPVALTEARHWHVEAPEAELPRGLSLVLLDDAGLVFAATPELGRDAVVRVEAFEDYRGALVAQEELPLWFPPMGHGGAPGPPHLTGGPRKLALAFPAEWRNLENPSGGGQITVPATATPPRLTIRPWPAPLPEEGAGSPKLEVVRSWGRSEELDAVPVIGLLPLRAAWISQGKIRVWDLEGERAEPPRVLTVEADLPAEYLTRSITWQGDQLHVFSTVRKKDGKDSTTVMVTVKPYEPESRPVSREFPGTVDAGRPVWPETADLPLFNVTSGGGTLRGILTADGRLLDPPSSATEPIHVRDAIGTGLSFHDSTGKLRALDWSDGTPRIRDIEPATTPGADRAGQDDRPGAVMTYPEIRAAFSSLPAQFPSLTALGGGRYLGRGMNSEAVSFVLLRKTPADK